MHDSRRYGNLLLVVAVLIIAGLTLAPGRPDAEPIPLACVFCGDLAAADAIRNIVLFLPLGAACGLLGFGVRRAALRGALLSAFVESAQLFIPGRDASVSDLLCNTTGAALGAWLVVSAPASLLAPRARARWYALGSALAAAITLSATGWLLQPTFPESVYFGQWTPHLGHLEWYRGRVLSAAAGGIPLPDGRVSDSKTLRARLQGDITVDVHAIAGPPVPGLASLVSIADDHERGILLLGPDHGDLVFRYRTRSVAATLEQPHLRLKDALVGVAPGDSLHAYARHEAGGFCLGANRTARCHMGFTVAEGWRLFLSVGSIPRWAQQAVGALWVGVLLVPLGFWASGRIPTAGGIAMVAAALVLLPRAAGLLPTRWHTWLGAAIGLGLGLLLRRAIAGRAVTGGIVAARP